MAPGNNKTLSCQDFIVIPFNELMEHNLLNTVFFSFIVILGIPSNIVVLLAYRHIQKANHKNKFTAVFVRLLSGCDIIICCTVFTHYVNMKNNIALCMLEQYLQIIPLMFSLCILVVIAAERYLAVCRPLVRMRTRHVSGLLGVSVAMTLAVAVVYASLHAVVAPDCCIISDERLLTAIITIYAVVNYLFIVLLLIVLYGLVFWAIYRRQMNRVGARPPENSSINTVSMVVTAAERRRERGNDGEEASATAAPSEKASTSKHGSASADGANTSQATRPSSKDKTASVTPARRRSERLQGTKRGQQLRRKPGGKANVQMKSALMFSLITLVFFLGWLPFWQQSSRESF
ncbi:PREDICTED: oxytocin receptor-like [Priapulus caudatus]|uniref:Oxytocin receptor-like n=1 Tax=Priapulus caudatus TaxID=37621 RepID=A0ABM1F1R8_PRICU|nr:PREDICTED: oxytocin receptor-like [Priapulus caudatus]